MFQIVKKCSILPVLLLCGSSLSRGATIAAFAQTEIDPPNNQPGGCHSVAGDETGFLNGAAQNVSCGPITLSFPTPQLGTAISTWNASASAVAGFGSIGAQSVGTMSGNDLQFAGSVLATSISSFEDVMTVDNPNLAPGAEFLMTFGFTLMGNTPADSFSNGLVDFINSANTVTLSSNTGGSQTFAATPGAVSITTEVFNGNVIELGANLTLEEEIEGNFQPGDCTSCGYSADQEFDYFNTLLLTSVTDSGGNPVSLINAESGTNYSQVIQANDLEVSGAPEPATAALAGSVLGLLAWARRKKRT